MMDAIKHMFVRTAALGAVLVACAVPAAFADDGTRRALLVGVNEYPTLEPRLSLRGPENDVGFMRELLVDLGFEDEHTTVLVTSAEDEGARPTRAAILRELDRLADVAGPEDVVYLHFAGHGSQQPDEGDDADGERDGLDEIFLPMDVGGWEGDSGSVENAITDDEIAARISAIRGTGAFVWAVFDACHSGTMTRSASTEDGVRYRNVRPEDLGISQDDVDAAVAAAPRTRGGGVDDRTLEGVGGSGEGGFVAFYAVQSHELAPEERLPRGMPGRVSRGVFSFTLAQTIAQAPDASYRQIAAQIVQRYRSQRRSETPIFEGDLDSGLFGGIAASPRQWPISEEGSAFYIEAGALEGIGEGSVVAILEAATDDDEAVLGYASLTDGTTTRSRLEPIAYSGVPQRDDALEARRFARLVDPAFTMLLRVHADASVAESPVTRAAVDQARASEDESLFVVWRDEAEGADVRLVHAEDRLWFLAPGACIPGRTTRSGDGAEDDVCPADAPPPPAIILGSRDADAVAAILEEWLGRAARATQLLSIPAEVATTDPTRALSVSLAVCEAGRTARERAMQQACISGDVPPREYTPEEVPELRDRDYVTIRASNDSNAPIDLTVLFVDSTFGIDAMFPARGELNRIAPGEQAEFSVNVNVDTIGDEQLIFLAVPGVDQSRDFAFLAQEGITTRGGPGGSRAARPGARASDMLMRAGTRGASRASAGGLGAVVTGWRTVQ